jgi:biotin synthase
MSVITSILHKEDFTRKDIISLLSITEPELIEELRCEAERVLYRYRGPEVYFRGLIEFSNICISDCYYCGIRKSNGQVKRYLMSKEEIIKCALWCAQQGYGSIVLQSGERQDKKFTDFVTEVVREIKKNSSSERLPQGLGITLCVGEQSRDVYQNFFNAGAHRYLLRIETSQKELFSSIHPSNQTYESRKSCLQMLKEIGFLVGTGVMIGLPGQSLEHLADDILFFKDSGVDMIGMGPFIVHEQTPFSVYKNDVQLESSFLDTLKMIAVTRLVLRDVNIAATTALQAIKPDGREYGLRFGANVVMPQITPEEFRKQYLLYAGKPCVEENAELCKTCLTRRVQAVGRTVATDVWGDRRSVQKD